MYRVKSHLWPVSRAFLKMLSLGHQFLLHVWAKIVPRARFSLPLHILHFSPSKIDGCFGYIRTSGSLVASCSPFALSTCKNQGMFRLKSHFWPAWRLHPLWVVSGPRISAFWCPKDTYFTSFSRLRSAFEKNHVFNGPFEALHGLRKWCKPARGTIFADTLVAFSQRKGGRTPFLRPTKVLFSP